MPPKNKNRKKKEKAKEDKNEPVISKEDSTHQIEETKLKINEIALDQMPNKNEEFQQTKANEIQQKKEDLIENLKPTFAEFILTGNTLPLEINDRPVVQNEIQMINLKTEKMNEIEVQNQADTSLNTDIKANLENKIETLNLKKDGNEDGSTPGNQLEYDAGKGVEKDLSFNPENSQMAGSNANITNILNNAFNEDSRSCLTDAHNLKAPNKYEKTGTDPQIMNILEQDSENSENLDIALPEKPLEMNEIYPSMTEFKTEQNEGFYEIEEHQESEIFGKKNDDNDSELEEMKDEIIPIILPETHLPKENAEFENIENEVGKMSQTLPENEKRFSSLSNRSVKESNAISPENDREKEDEISAKQNESQLSIASHKRVNDENKKLNKIACNEIFQENASCHSAQVPHEHKNFDNMSEKQAGEMKIEENNEKSLTISESEELEIKVVQQNNKGKFKNFPEKGNKERVSISEIKQPNEETPVKSNAGRRFDPRVENSPKKEMFETNEKARSMSVSKSEKIDSSSSFNQTDKKECDQDNLKNKEKHDKQKKKQIEMAITKNLEELSNEKKENINLEEIAELHEQLNKNDIKQTELDESPDINFNLAPKTSNDEEFYTKLEINQKKDFIDENPLKFVLNEIYSENESNSLENTPKKEEKSENEKPKTIPKNSPNKNEEETVQDNEKNEKKCQTITNQEKDIVKQESELEKAANYKTCLVPQENVSETIKENLAKIEKEKIINRNEKEEHNIDDDNKKANKAIAQPETTHVFTTNIEEFKIDKSKIVEFEKEKAENSDLFKEIESNKTSNIFSTGPVLSFNNSPSKANFNKGFFQSISAPQQLADERLDVSEKQETINESNIFRHEKQEKSIIEQSGQTGDNKMSTNSKNQMHLMSANSNFAKKTQFENIQTNGSPFHAIENEPERIESKELIEKLESRTMGRDLLPGQDFSDPLKNQTVFLPHLQDSSENMNKNSENEKITFGDQENKSGSPQIEVIENNQKELNKDHRMNVMSIERNCKNQNQQLFCSEVIASNDQDSNCSDKFIKNAKLVNSDVTDSDFSKESNLVGSLFIVPNNRDKVDNIQQFQLGSENALISKQVESLPVSGIHQIQLQKLQSNPTPNQPFFQNSEKKFDCKSEYCESKLEPNFEHKNHFMEKKIHDEKNRKVEKNKAGKNDELSEDDHNKDSTLIQPNKHIEHLREMLGNERFKIFECEKMNLIKQKELIKLLEELKSKTEENKDLLSQKKNLEKSLTQEHDEKKKLKNVLSNEQDLNSKKDKELEKSAIKIKSLEDKCFKLNEKLKEQIKNLSNLKGENKFNLTPTNRARGQSKQPDTDKLTELASIPRNKFFDPKEIENINSNDFFQNESNHDFMNPLLEKKPVVVESEFVSEKKPFARSAIEKGFQKISTETIRKTAKFYSAYHKLCLDILGPTSFAYKFGSEKKTSLVKKSSERFLIKMVQTFDENCKQIRKHLGDQNHEKAMEELKTSLENYRSEIKNHLKKIEEIIRENK